MANITASDVNKLRQATGAGMMDCKNALVEANGDFELATDILRKKGQKIASKRADRDATEGVVLAKTNTSKTRGIVIALNCETDFVAKNEDFIAFTNLIADSALTHFPNTKEELLALSINGRTINDLIIDNIGKIGEKIDISSYEKIEAAVVNTYNHHNKKLSSLIGLSKSGEACENAAHELCMQIASMNPIALDKDQVPSDVIEKEIEIAKDILRQEGKAEDMLEKIAMGKLNKFYKEVTLLNQDYTKDNKKSIREYLKEVDAEVTVTSFKRVGLGM